MASGIAREEITAQIKEQTDIVQVIGEHVDLKKSGVRYLGLCPFHGEKTPSFSVHGGQQFFHCFGCGESGDVFSFVMKYHNLDFVEALKLLAARCNIELPTRKQTQEEEARSKKKEALFKVNAKAATEYQNYLLQAGGGEAARKYLQKRGVKREIVERYRIGYAPAVEVEGWNYLGSRFLDNEMDTAIEAGLLVKKEQGGSYDRFRDRIVFPILNVSGQVCGFGGRIVGEGQPKYLNSPESLVYNKSKQLLGLYQQKESIRRVDKAIMVEGNFDLISLAAGGCENVVAPLGTALTRPQLRLLKRFCKEVVLLFDGDDAGVKAAVRAVELFFAEQLSGRVAILPSGHDPDTYIKDFGLNKINELVEKAETLPEFVFSRWVEMYGLTLDGKRKIVEELTPLVKSAASPLQRNLLVSHFAEKLAMDSNVLEKHLHQAVSKTSRSEEVRQTVKREVKAGSLTIPQKQLVRFMVLNPRFFGQLAESGIRYSLSGSLGEILYLELEKLLQKRPEAEPEELLSLLPEGQERRFVADLLLGATGNVSPEKAEQESEELLDLLGFLKKEELRRSSEELLGKIQQAQADGDLPLLQQLMKKKVEITQKLHSS